MIYGVSGVLYLTRPGSSQMQKVMEELYLDMTEKLLRNERPCTFSITPLPGLASVLYEIRFLTGTKQSSIAARIRKFLNSCQQRKQIVQSFSVRSILHPPKAEDKLCSGVAHLFSVACANYLEEEPLELAPYQFQFALALSIISLKILAPSDSSPLREARKYKNWLLNLYRKKYRIQKKRLSVLRQEYVFRRDRRRAGFMSKHLLNKRYWKNLKDKTIPCLSGRNCLALTEAARNLGRLRNSFGSDYDKTTHKLPRSLGILVTHQVYNRLCIHLPPLQESSFAEILEHIFSGKAKASRPGSLAHFPPWFSISFFCKKGAVQALQTKAVRSFIRRLNEGRVFRNYWFICGDKSLSLIIESCNRKRLSSLQRQLHSSIQRANWPDGIQLVNLVRYKSMSITALGGRDALPYIADIYSAFRQTYLGGHIRPSPSQRMVYILACIKTILDGLNWDNTLLLKYIQQHKMFLADVGAQRDRKVAGNTVIGLESEGRRIFRKMPCQVLEVFTANQPLDQEALQTILPLRLSNAVNNFARSVVPFVQEWKAAMVPRSQLSQWAFEKLVHHWFTFQNIRWMEEIFALSLLQCYLKATTPKPILFSCKRLSFPV